MSKSPDAFRTISEVAEWLGIQTHVLRFWESKFTQIKPVKRAGGRRYYRPADMLLLGGIKKLLHDDGITIKGVQKILREKGVAHVSDLSRPIDAPNPELVIDDTPIEATVIAFKPERKKSPPKPEAEPDVEQFAMDLGQPDGDIEAEVLEPADATPPPSTKPDVIAPHPIVVEVSDPPAPSDLPALSGVLSRLPNLVALDDEIRDDIADLVGALKDWHDRATNLTDR